MPVGLLFLVVLPGLPGWTLFAGRGDHCDHTLVVGPCHKHWEEEQGAVPKIDPVLQQWLGEVCQGKELLLLPFQIHRSIPPA